MTADPGSLKELERLKEVYQKQFTELTRGVTAKYAKALGDLEITAARTRDTETLALVRQEKQRMSQPESRTPGPGAARVRSKLRHELRGGRPHARAGRER